MEANAGFFCVAIPKLGICKAWQAKFVEKRFSVYHDKWDLFNYGREARGFSKDLSLSLSFMIRLGRGGGLVFGDGFQPNPNFSNLLGFSGHFRLHCLGLCDK